MEPPTKKVQEVLLKSMMLDLSWAWTWRRRAPEASQVGVLTS